MAGTRFAFRVNLLRLRQANVGNSGMTGLYNSLVAGNSERM